MYNYECRAITRYDVVNTISPTACACRVESPLVVLAEKGHAPPRWPRWLALLSYPVNSLRPAVGPIVLASSRLLHLRESAWWGWEDRTTFDVPSQVLPYLASLPLVVSAISRGLCLFILGERPRLQVDPTFPIPVVHGRGWKGVRVSVVSSAKLVCSCM